jgi:hypothetical protein
VEHIAREYAYLVSWILINWIPSKVRSLSFSVAILSTQRIQDEWRCCCIENVWDIETRRASLWPILLSLSFAAPQRPTTSDHIRVSITSLAKIRLKVRLHLRAHNHMSDHHRSLYEFTQSTEDALIRDDDFEINCCYRYLHQTNIIVMFIDTPCNRRLESI